MSEHGTDVVSRYLPTVSVIVTNYNYGRFVGEALASIADQTYPHVETVVVDDVSTDDSWPTICALTAPDGPHAAAKRLRMATNGGQTLASHHGFVHSTGAYVIFLDADDILLPECVEAHVNAHLSTRLPVGFSSVDNFNILNGQLVTATSNKYFASYIASGNGQIPSMIRSIADVAPDSWFGQRRPVLRSDQIHLAPAPHCDWIWAPSSGNCFRREWLDILLNGPRLADLRRSTDGFTMPPIAAISGSMLVDRPLMGYRVHGGNMYVSGAPLAGLLNHDEQALKGPTSLVVKAGIQKLFDEVERLGPLLESPDHFFEAARNLCGCLAIDFGIEGFLNACLVENEGALTRAFGADAVARWTRAATPRARRGAWRRFRAAG